MNPELEFARKTALAYNALCRPLFGERVSCEGH